MVVLVASLAGTCGPQHRESVGLLPDEAGVLSQRDVERAIEVEGAAILGCYEDELEETPGLIARIEYEWTVTRNGSVQDVRISAARLAIERPRVVGEPELVPVPSTDLEHCVLKVIEGMRFPRVRANEATARYRFYFRDGISSEVDRAWPYREGCIAGRNGVSFPYRHGISPYEGRCGQNVVYR